VIGVTHNASYSPFHAGGTATPGLEQLCEEGKHQPLDAEIRSAIEAGNAGTLIETAIRSAASPARPWQTSRLIRPTRWCRSAQ
jgi:hypothetical protein